MSTQVSRKYLNSNGSDGDGDNDFDFDPSSLHDQTGPQLDEAFITSQPPEHQVWLRSLSRDPVKLLVDIVHYICALDSKKQVFADLVHLCTKSDPKSVMHHCYNSSNTSGLDGIQFTSCSSSKGELRCPFKCHY